MKDNFLHSVTFVIPHRGRPEMLRQTLASIACLNAEGVSMSVIVVTQETNLDLDDLLPDTNLDVQVTTKPERVTISELRNIGVAQSESDFLVFLDADIALSENWLQVMFQLINKSSQTSCSVVSAYQVASQGATALETVRVALSNMNVDCCVGFLPGRNLFLRRSTFDAVGGFPTHLETCEDYYFTEQASRIAPLFYTSAASYVHLGEDTHFGPFFKKEIWRAQSNLLSIKGRTIPLSEWPSFMVPCWVAIFLVSFFLGIITFRFGFALVSILLALVPVALYSLRLWMKKREQLTLWSIVNFYAVYFPARAYGSIVGLVKGVKGS